MPDKFRDYALLRFVCPRGHALGRAFMEHSGKWALEAGSSLIVESGKIRARCPDCASEGKFPTLQASGEKVAERLRQLRADPGRGTDTYRIGG